MIWKILGIEKTKEKKAITHAYRERLACVNPEEKQEEFKELRSAYEKALAYADQEEVPNKENTPINLWIEEVKAVYDWFPDRINVDAWKQLLDTDICQALDTRPLVEEALLRFLMDNFHISQKVMIYLNEEFGFMDRMQELQEKFPKDFLDYVIVDSILYGETLPLEMFVPGLDGAACDAYLANFYQARKTTVEELEPIIKAMDESTEKHPYGESLILKAALHKEYPGYNPDKLLKLETLQREYPEDLYLAMDLAAGYHLIGNTDKLESLCEWILKKYPNHGNARRYLAEAKAARGEYKEADEIINQLMQEAEGDGRVLYELNEIKKQWNAAYAEKLEKKLQENPDDAQARFDLIWCYIENEEHERALELAEKLEVEQPDPFSYYNLKAVLSGCSGQNEDTLEYLEKLLKAVEQLVPDGTEKTERKIARKAEVMGRIAGTLFQLNRKDEAAEMVDKTLAENPEDMRNLVHMIQITMGLKQFAKAAELSNRYIEKNPRNAQGYVLKAVACFRMRQDEQAFQYVNTALDLEGTDLLSYLLKLQILIRNGAYEPADELIRFLEENGVVEHPCISWCQIQRFNDTCGDNPNRDELEKILELAERVDAQIASGDFGKPDWAAEFYYTYAVLTADMQSIVEEYPLEPLYALLNKGIALNPDDYNCCTYKAWLLKNEKKNADALKIYKELEQLPRNSLYIEKQLAELYYADLENQAGEALHYYEMLIQENPEDSLNYFFAGICCMRMDRLDEARNHFLNEQKYDPDDIDGYYRIATVYHKLNRLEEALEMANITVAMAKKRREDDTTHFWKPLIRVYTRMQRPFDAVAAIRECKEYNKDWNNWSEIFDIYEMFGLHKDAEALIDSWKMEKNDQKGWASAEATHLMLLDSAEKLSTHLRRFRKVMDEDTIKKADSYIALQKGNLNEYLSVTRNSDREPEETAYMLALWLNGFVEQAQREARKVITFLDSESEKYSVCRMLYLVKRLSVLVVLGREQEAREELIRLRTHPLCEQCGYHSCKDLDIYEIEMELICGNCEKALKLAEKYFVQWPDEIDFLDLKNIAKEKIKHAGRD